MRRATQTGLIAAVSLLTAIVIVVVVAHSQRTATVRCPPGTQSLGARCCAEGQQLRGDDCAGPPTVCPPGTEVVGGLRPGCMATVQEIRFTGGTLRLAPSDWEAQGVVTTRELRVSPFMLDSTEVTFERWQRCVDAGGCRRLSWQEPGRPVVNVAPDEAQTFCRFLGGRLPTAAEWLFAATGTEARRYPWGATGLVCRRAAFGLVAGPCAEGARGPELAGFRAGGATPEGVHDLAGNVAEWTVEAEGAHAARGGSYLSQVAAELKTWAVEPNHGPAPHIGFRCAYDDSE